MTATLSTDFDHFLFAPIGEGAAGIPVTVLSALARLDLDPWEEAANLFRLAAAPATERLASLLALPETTASRLVKLLQESPTKRARAPEAPSRGAEATSTQRSNTTIYYLAALIFMLVGLWAMAVGHSEVPIDLPHATSAD